ncbi:MAG: secretin N-terminal domain-containing protein [Nitrospirota bacterium]
MRRIIIVAIFSLLLSGCVTNKEIRIGDQFVEEGNWNGAIFLYEEALKKDPTNREIRDKLQRAKSKAAEIHYILGKEYIKEEHLSLAIGEFRKGLSLDISNKEIQSALSKTLKQKDAEEYYKIGKKLARTSKFEAAISEFKKALKLVPDYLPAQEAIKKVKREKKSRKSEDKLSLISTQPITLKFQNAKLKEVFEVLSRAGGINIIFDKDVRDSPISIFIKDASFKEALNLILSTNNLFMKKINDNTILIIPSTPQKTAQYEDLMIRTFYLTNIKAKNMVNLVRTMLETKRVFVNEDLNAIIIRDTPDKIRLAEKIIEANDQRPAEAVFDVEIIEVDTTKTLQYGWNFAPNQITANIKDASAISLNALRNLGDTAYIFTLPSVIVDFIKQESDAKTLARPRIRVLDNRTAKVTVGDRIPIELSTTTQTSATAVTSSGVTTSTSIEFKDVGIKLTVDPDIHLNNDITLKLNLEVTSLGEKVKLGQTEQFKFGNRHTETVLNIKDGETVIIGGLIREEDRNIESKFPGLGDIPVLGKLFSGIRKEKTKVDIILTITPHIVRTLDIPGEDIQAFWSGTGRHYSIEPFFTTDISDIPDIDLITPITPSVPQEKPVEPPAKFPIEEEIIRPPAFQREKGSITKDKTVSPSLLAFNPSYIQVSAGEEFEVQTDITNIHALSDARLSISFDPEILEFKKAVEDYFLKEDGWTTQFITSSNIDKGMITIMMKRVKDINGISGSGHLFKLIFSAKSKGDTQIRLTNNQLFTPSKKILSVHPAFADIKVR